MDTPPFYNYHANIWIYHISINTMPIYEYTTFLQLPCQHMNTSLPIITMPTYEYITPYNYHANT